MSTKWKRPSRAADALKPEGCARCRMDLIKFVIDVELPRFTMRTGEQWHTPQTAYVRDGKLKIGGGLAPRRSFKIIKVDDSRANHNGGPCL